MNREWVERKPQELPEAAPKAHNYPPVWDETLKSWINKPPHGMPGKGAKE